MQTTTPPDPQGIIRSMRLQCCLTPDPSGGSVNQGDPQSWNRYAYTKNDPINRNDPTGLFISAEDCIGNPDACDAYDWGQPGDLWGAPDAPIGPNGLPCGWGYGTACGIYPGDGCVEPSPGSGYGAPPDPTPTPCPPPPAQPPALPTCTLTVESRPLGYWGLQSFGPDLHGYLDFTSGNPLYPTTLIFEGRHNGSLLQAAGAPTGPGDDPDLDNHDGSISGPAVCSAQAALERDVSLINRFPINYGGAFGPNSNSVLRYMLESISFLQYILNEGLPWYNIPLSMQFFGYYTPLPGLEAPNPFPPRPPLRPW